MQYFVERAEIDHTQANRKKDTNYLDNMGENYDFTTMYTQINLIQLLNIKFLDETRMYLIAPNLLSELKQDLLNKISKEELLQIFEQDSKFLNNNSEYAYLINEIITDLSYKISKEQLSGYIDELEYIYYDSWRDFDEIVDFLENLTNKKSKPITRFKELVHIDNEMHSVYGGDECEFDSTTTQGQIGYAISNLLELIRKKEKCTMLEETNR